LTQNCKNTVNTEIQNALQYLQKARKFYKLADLDYGTAKVNLIEAEFQIEKSYGSGLSIEYDPDKITTLLIEAHSLFKKYKYESLQVRCLRNLAILKSRMEEYYEAKRLIEDALNLVKKIQDKHQEGLCSEILNEILDQIRIKSNNVFIFAKAFPLVEE
jgi:tetratricopeptide (TPR) repeat protein